LLPVPVFSAGRYVAIKAARNTSLQLDHNVLRSAAYLDTVSISRRPERAKREPSAGTFAERIGRSFRCTPTDRADRGDGPFLQIGRIDVSAAIEEIQRLVQHGAI
jgi:hypothetical protein